MYHNITLEEYISKEISTKNREGLKDWVSSKASHLLKFHPSNRPKDLDAEKNPKLANAFKSAHTLELVLCADSTKAIPVVEESLNENGLRLVKIDCRLFPDRNSLFYYIAHATLSSRNGPYNWDTRCDTSIPWDYILLFDHVEAFDPVNEEGDVNPDLRFCLRAVGSILKNDSHKNPPTIAIVSPGTPFSDEFFSELFTRSYANSFLYSE